MNNLHAISAIIIVHCINSNGANLWKPMHSQVELRHIIANTIQSSFFLMQVREKQLMLNYLPKNIRYIYFFSSFIIQSQSVQKWI